MSLEADLEASSAFQDRRTRPSYPDGWTPGLEITSDGGTLTAAPSDTTPDWDSLLADYLPDGWDASEFQVDPDSVSFTAWDGWGRDGQGDTATSRRQYSFRARIIRRKSTQVDMSHWRKHIRSHKPATTKSTSTITSLVVAWADWQIGKALADDTPVLTTEGWVEHGDLRPGHYVYGPDGLPKLVLAVTGSTMQPMYRVQFGKDTSLRASADHRWSGWRRYKDSAGKYERRRLTWTTAEIAEMQPTERQGRIYTERAFHVDLPESLKVPDADLPIDSYLLGAWLGDGTAAGGWITSSVDDIDHWLGRFDCYTMPTSPSPTTENVRFPGLTAKLSKLGVLGAKHVPEQYLLASSLQRLALLQGLMDTDGHVTPTGQCEFVNTNFQVAESVAFLVASLGMKARVTEKLPTINGEPKSPALRVQFRPDSDDPDQQVFRMERKLRRLRAAGGDQSRYRFIQSVTPDGESMAQCITVEGSLYLAGRDLIVTHNSEGGGWRATVDRFIDAIGKTQDRLRESKPETLYVLSLGDLVEGCSGHYAQQTFGSELNATQQQEVVVDMAVRGLRDLSKHAPRIVVAPVGGNHGEVRQNGKSFTDFADNYDVSLYRHVRRVFAENDDAYGHISFAIPQADLTQTIDVSGLLVGIAHGHQFRRGTNAVDAAEKWWRGQMAGQQPIGDADLLLAGHRHHLVVSRQGSRTFMQAPALDGGSAWFTDVSGLESPPGTLSFVVEDGEWDQLRVL